MTCANAHITSRTLSEGTCAVGVGEKANAISPLLQKIKVANASIIFLRIFKKLTQFKNFALQQKKWEEKLTQFLPNFCFRNSKKSSAIFYVLTPQKTKKFENQTGSVLLESTPPFFNFFISDLILLKNHQFHFEFLEHFQRILFQHF